MTMPPQKPHRSEQSVGTPRAFLDAVEAKFGPITLDCAASADNAVCPRYINEARNGLTVPWDDDEGTLNWCNPPFSKIAPWVEKAVSQTDAIGSSSLLLLPAGVGSNWWLGYVHGACDVYLLNGRLTFVGHSAPYPKDLVLLHYHPGASRQACCDPATYRVWPWREGRTHR